MDFLFNLALGVSQVVGPGPGEVLPAIVDIKDGDPRSWVESFNRLGVYLSERASMFQ
jgi:hypothetical protein